MTKTIVVSDRVFAWLDDRTRQDKPIAQVLQEIIKAVERYEADLSKYQAWVDASQPILENYGGALPPQGEEQ